MRFTPGVAVGAQQFARDVVGIALDGDLGVRRHARRRRATTASSAAAISDGVPPPTNTDVAAGKLGARRAPRGTRRRTRRGGDGDRSTSRTRSSRTASSRTGCGCKRRTRRYARDGDAELVEAAAHDRRRRLEQERQRAQVVAANREAARREVLALDLDHPDVAADQLALFGGQAFEAGEVDDDGRTFVAGDGPARRRARGALAQVERGAPSSPGQQMVDRDLVQRGEPLQPGDGNRALAALVGAQHRRPELAVGPRLDRVQRQVALLAHGPEALADANAVVRRRRLRGHPLSTTLRGQEHRAKAAVRPGRRAARSSKTPAPRRRFRPAGSWRRDRPCGTSDSSSSVQPPSGPTATAGDRRLSGARHPGGPARGRLGLLGEFSERWRRRRSWAARRAATASPRRGRRPGALEVARRLGVVPPHDAARAAQRHDAVDAELGQLLHDQLGLVALRQRERRSRPQAPAVGAVAIGATGSDNPAPETRTAATARAVTGGDGLAVAQSQHPRRWCASSSFEDRHVEVVDEHVGGRGGQPAGLRVEMTHASHRGLQI